ncbi:hypothetical protein HYX01_04455 [Candidatus Woesearchaeota archaeon]|nr:hypothetical protein [Candidatus Woesearchaeota archaeon]
MKQQAIKQLSYFELIKTSLKLLFKNYVVFIPMIFFGLFTNLIIFTPQYKAYAKELIISSFQRGMDAQISTPNTLLSLSIYSLISIILNYIALGWIFALIQPIVLGKNVSLFFEFKNGLKSALNFFGLSLLLFALIFFSEIVIMLISIPIALLFRLSPSISVILIFLIFIAAFALFIFLTSYIFQIISAFIMERKGPLLTISIAWAHYKKYFGHSLALFGIAMLLIALFSPAIIAFILMYISYLLLSLTNPAAYYFISIAIQFLWYCFLLWILTFYSMAYNQKTKKSAKQIS